jgi:hypothetical protein
LKAGLYEYSSTIGIDRKGMDDMMEAADADLFKQCIVASRAAFASGHYDAAFHILTGTLQLVEDLASEKAAITVTQVAREQLSWINRLTSLKRVPTQTAHERERVERYEQLIRSAELCQNLIRTHQRRAHPDKPTTLE